MLPRRNVQPLRVKLLVERPVVGGDPGQVGGVLDGVRVHVLVPLEARADTNPSSAETGSTPAQGIAVTDLSGNYPRFIDTGSGAEGLTLAPDGNVYAALSTAGVVAEINPTTLSET